MVWEVQGASLHLFQGDETPFKENLQLSQDIQVQTHQPDCGASGQPE